MSASVASTYFHIGSQKALIETCQLYFIVFLKILISNSFIIFDIKWFILNSDTFNSITSCKSRLSSFYFKVP